MANNRLPYFDIIKGIAIFLVVTGHVLTMCIREIDQAFAFKLIGEIHMPLFFFISGFFIYKSNDKYQFVTPRLGRKFIQLILPLLTVGSLWILYFPHSGLDSPLKPGFEGFWSDPWKNGYWFTLCLFEITLLYTVSSVIFRHIKSYPLQIIITTVIWVLTNIAAIYLPDTICNAIGFTWIITFFPIFMFGVYAKKYEKDFMTLIGKPTVTAISVVGAAITLYMICYPWEFSFMNYAGRISLKMIFHLCLVCFCVYTTKSWTENRPNNTVIREISHLGQNSLSIYLLHYFFLFPMAFLQEPLRNMGLGFAPTITIASVAAAIIISFALLADYLISRNRFLALILLGKHDKR